MKINVNTGKRTPQMRIVSFILALIMVFVGLPYVGVNAAVGDILHAVRIILKTGYPCSFLGPGQFYSIGFLQFLSVAPGLHGDGDGISVF